MELGPEPVSEPHRALDLDFAYRDALDVQSEGNADAPAKGDQLARRRDRLILGRFEGVISMAQIVRDPARHIDTEPPKKLNVFIEPQTENVKTIGTGSRCWPAHS